MRYPFKPFRIAREVVSIQSCFHKEGRHYDGEYPPGLRHIVAGDSYKQNAGDLITSHENEK
jgi:hypothetical protein